MKDEREKRLLFKRHKAVRFLISPKKKKVKIEVNKIMNPSQKRKVIKAWRCNQKMDEIQINLEI